MKRIILRGLLITVALCMAISAGAEQQPGVTIELSEYGWTWEASRAAGFQGTVRAEGYDGDSLVLKLSVAVTPEDPSAGQIIFQTVNGKMLTIRKQSDTCTVSLGEGREATFIGNWKTPEKIYANKVTVKVQAYAADGTTLLGEKTLEVIRDTATAADVNDGRIRITTDIPMWTTIFAVAAGSIWILALIRILINRRKKR